MKYKYFLPLIVLLVFFETNRANCQTYSTKNHYSTLSSFLESKLGKIKIADSCVSGFYFITFKIRKDHLIENFNTSFQLETNLQAEIKKSIYQIFDSVDNKYIKNLIKSKATILLPLLVLIDNNCKQKETPYLSKINLDSANTIETRLAISNSVSYSYAQIILSLKETFSSSLIFSKRNLKRNKLIVIEPCTIQYTELKNRKM